MKQNKDLRATQKEVETMFRSKYGAVWVRTGEELRARRMVQATAAALECKTVFWSCVGGFGQMVSSGRVVWQAEIATNPDGDGIDIDEIVAPVNSAFDGMVHDELSAAFQSVRGDSERAVYCFLDAAELISNEVTGTEPKTMRALKEMLAAIGEYTPESAKAFCFIDRRPAPGLSNVVEIDLPLPTRGEVQKIVEAIVSVLPNREKVEQEIASNGTMDKIIGACLGLEAEQINNAIKTSVVACGSIDPARLLESKKTIIKGSGFVEWIEPDETGLDNIGGVEQLKGFVRNLRPRFQSKALEYGLKKPLGMFVGGVPGTAKSATFKAMLNEFEMVGMLVRPVESKYVGESQANLLEVFRLARAAAPCCLLWDEVEKTFAAAGTDSSGVTLKLLGILLTEMQKDFDGDTGVFHYFTANNPLNVAGELFRRCESLFWVDLPNTDELEAIGEVMQVRYPRTSGVDLREVARAARNRDLTGAELEKAFLGGMTLSFADGARDTVTADILKAMETIVPVIKSYAKQIEALRQWGKNVSPASAPEKRVKRTGVDDKLSALM